MEYNQDLELLEVYTEDNQTRIGIAERGVAENFQMEKKWKLR